MLAARRRASQQVSSVTRVRIPNGNWPSDELVRTRLRRGRRRWLGVRVHIGRSPQTRRPSPAAGQAATSPCADPHPGSLPRTGKAKRCSRSAPSGTLSPLSPGPPSSWPVPSLTSPSHEASLGLLMRPLPAREGPDMKCLRCLADNPTRMKFAAKAPLPWSPSAAPAARAIPRGTSSADTVPPSLGKTIEARFQSPDTYTPKHLGERILTSKAALHRISPRPFAFPDADFGHPSTHSSASDVRGGSVRGIGPRPRYHPYARDVTAGPLCTR
jgi:hypothetical protein